MEPGVGREKDPEVSLKLRESSGTHAQVKGSQSRLLPRGVTRGERHFKEQVEMRELREETKLRRRKLWL